MVKDTYKTIESPSEETLHKAKGSKFYGYTFPVSNEEEVKICLEKVKKLHHSARHVCYAYQIGEEQIRFRANDDGEPSNSAGMPIYGQIQSFEVTNILVVSVRYFGGVKLGVGGLISAYKTSAQLSLEASEILEKTIDVKFLLKFDYDLMNSVQRIIKEKKITIVKQTLELDCEYVISIRKKDSDSVFDIFNQLYKVSIKRIE
jgi:uncharacterized YigZ family protein